MCKIPLSKQLAGTGCPTKHDSWWIALNVLYYILFNTKNNNKNTIWELCYSKIDFKVKYIQAKDLFNKMYCEKPLISNTVYGRRHLKLFTHVPWDTLYFPGILFQYWHQIFNISRITLNFRVFIQNVNDENLVL